MAMKTHRTPEWVGIPIQYTESISIDKSIFIIYATSLQNTSARVLQPSSPVFSGPQSLE